MTQPQPSDEIRQLQDRFGIPGVATIEAGQGGLARVAVTGANADAHVYLHGAHVTHFQPKGASPVLFMSKESLFQPGKAIRGGVPVILPWFGAKADDPKAPQHGFARAQPWALQEIDAGGGGDVTVTFALGPGETSQKFWPHDFEAVFTVTVGAALTMALDVRNTGRAPFTFEEALHTYLAVADVRRCQLTGLEGRTFIDKVNRFQRKAQQGPMVITGETDRVYLNTPDRVTVNDPAGGRRLEVDKTGSQSTIVWNPWTEKAKAMADFGDDEWPAMVCVETANAVDNAVTLQPGATHTMTAVVRLVR
jgi:glucose-6-phosphate 1-epimerase